MTIPVQNNPATDTTASTASLGGAQSFMVMGYTVAPSWFGTVLAFVLGILAVLGTQQVIKRERAKRIKPCRHCRGTGEEQADKAAAGVCGDCNGTGQVEDEDQPTVECKHCEGEGEDPCHRCKGSGKIAGQECPACKGGGKTLTGKQDKDGEDEVADCEICRGEGEVESPVKKMVTCDTCGGTGKA